jgi:hypothetical protein
MDEAEAAHVAAARNIARATGLQLVRAAAPSVAPPPPSPVASPSAGASSPSTASDASDGGATPATPGAPRRATRRLSDALAFAALD